MEKPVFIEKLNPGCPVPLPEQGDERIWLLWAKNGPGTIEFNYKKHQVKKGRLFFLSRQGCRSLAIHWSGGGWLISLQPWLLRQFFRCHPEESLLPLFRSGKRPYADIFPATGLAMNTLALFMEQEQKAGNGYRISQSYLYVFLLHLASAYRLFYKLPMRPFDHQRAEKALRLIGEHFLSQRQPAFYAQKLGTTIRRLNDVCQAGTGKLVSELLSEHLLTEAERLLAESAFSIKQIAYELDFADMAAFNHFMNKHGACSPTEFRRALFTDNQTVPRRQAEED